MLVDNLVDDEAEQALHQLRLDGVLTRQRFETRHLPRFARCVDSGELVGTLEMANLVGTAETLTDQRDDACVNGVNLLSERLKFRYALHAQLPIMPEAGELGDAE